MTSNQQMILKGSIVQSRQHGWQGIVTKIQPNLWASSSDEKETRKLIANRGFSEDQAKSEQWITAASFEFPAFAAPKSDLFVIPISKVRFDEFPNAFHGEIISVMDMSPLKSVNILISTNRSPAATNRDNLIGLTTQEVINTFKQNFAAIKKGYTDSLTIKGASIVPRVGDVVIGNQEALTIIQGGDVSIPYLRFENQLRQNW